MNIAGEKLFIPPDVIFVATRTLSNALRRRLGADLSDGYAITRLCGRSASKLVEADGMHLLEEFRTPKTIVEAVVSFSDSSGADPATTLESAVPLLQRMIAENFLMATPRNEDFRRMTPTLKMGDAVAGFEILTCIQLLEDTEVYQAFRHDGRIAALKLARPARTEHVNRNFRREAVALRALDGSINPMLLDVGEWSGRQFLAVEWCDGETVTTAAAKARSRPGKEGRRRLLDMCLGILKAYAHIHGQGVIHSDVHPRNVLIADGGAVRIIDYGLSRVMAAEADGGDRPHRGGVPAYFDPELAQALKLGRAAPACTLLAEQYSIAALLYQVLTGAQYVAFSLEKSAMLRQICEDDPLPFIRHGLRPWPAVERTLCRALQKDPDGRFNSVTEFAQQIGCVSVDESPPLVTRGPGRPQPSAARALLDSWLDRFSILSMKPPAPPSGSVNLGLAGIAFTLYRLSCLNDSARFLTLADRAITRAEATIGRPESFFSEALQVTENLIGPVSLYHTASGIHCVRALISQAFGDMAACQKAIESFVSASGRPCKNVDLALGSAGTLVGSALLLSAVSSPKNFVRTESMMHSANAVLHSLWRELDTYDEIQSGTEIAALGIAHGWAGILYATMLWCEVSSSAMPVQVHRRLEQLANCAEMAGGGARWRWTTRQVKTEDAAGAHMPGWCNGSAGMVHLWTKAYRVFKNEKWLELAGLAACNAWEQWEGGVGDLCCGYAGRAYAFLSFYKLTGEALWLTRANEFANLAASSIRNWCVRPESLYKGEVGVVLLAADLDAPETSAMPMFEPEGWPST